MWSQETRPPRLFRVPKPPSAQTAQLPDQNQVADEAECMILFLITKEWGLLRASLRMFVVGCSWASGIGA
jgi:hypothetical protein